MGGCAYCLQFYDRKFDVTIEYRRVLKESARIFIYNRHRHRLEELSTPNAQLSDCLGMLIQILQFVSCFNVSYSHVDLPAAIS